ncbi:MAG: hypothetical protein K2L96_04535 [Muribaculaceae bacterium]|nr:hypothetical protein [Muribaculaceae bacterium]
MPCKKKTTAAEKLTEDVKKYPGVAIDSADENDVDRELVKERTKTLNNNPRDEGE